MGQIAPTEAPTEDGGDAPAESARLGPWAGGKSRVRAAVIVNQAAGSVRAGAHEDMRRLLADAGVDVSAVADGADLLSDTDAAGADLIVVLGGDGTARAAAARFAHGPPLILLPGGTLNVLAHALYGDQLDWTQALRTALRHGRETRLIGGEANGKVFFVAALFGGPTLLARVRESARHGRLVSAWRRFRAASRHFTARSLAVRPANGPATRAEAVGVLCPAYGGDIDGHALEWVRLDTSHIGDMARVGLRAVIGGWRNDSTIDLSHTDGGELRSLGLIPATLDGEPTTFVSRVRVRIIRRGPRVIVVD